MVNVLSAIAWHESRSNPNAVNPQAMADGGHASGMFQHGLEFRRQYGEINGKEDNYANWKRQAANTAAALNEFYGQYHDLDKALVAYAWGKGNLEKAVDAATAAGQKADWHSFISNEAKGTLIHERQLMGLPTDLSVYIYNNTGGSAVVSASGLGAGTPSP
jgi:hypothetical protein